MPWLSFLLREWCVDNETRVEKRSMQELLGKRIAFSLPDALEDEHCVRGRMRD